MSPWEGYTLTERELIALGGLLHDIGKFLQRARDKGFRFGDSDSDNVISKDFWKQNKDYLERTYGNEHAYLSKVFLDFLRKEGVIDDKLNRKLTNWGVRHHNPVKDDLGSVISQVADWYSSSERENILGSCINLLHSVFERVSLIPKDERKYDWVVNYEKTEYEKKVCENIVSYLEHNKTETITSGFYKLRSLSTQHMDSIFPESFESSYVKLKIIYKKENRQVIRETVIVSPNSIKDLERADVETQNYDSLFKSFSEDFLKAKEIKDSSDQFFNYIYYLLYKYTWCVPASRFDRSKGSAHYPDISLFDHSRVLSAIAVALYDWAIANNKTAQEIKPRKIKGQDGKDMWELPTDKEKVFLLVEGDIGGIQDFIYNIHKATAESELSIAKALRGRSFFLTMLPEVIARYILKELDYPITNALFIGGGKFQLLVANTKSNTEKLEAIEKEINEWMHEEFQGELTFSIAYVSMKGSALRDREIKEDSENDKPRTYLDHIEWLQLELDKKKKRKFKELLFEGFENEAIKAGEICPSCRTLKAKTWEIDSEKVNLCKWCMFSSRWGEVLPKVKYIAFDWGRSEQIKLNDGRKIMKFGNFGHVYLLEEEDLKKVKELTEILNIEDTVLKLESHKVVNGFKFIGHSAPRITKDLESLFKELWDEKHKDQEQKERAPKAGDILPFELLVEFAQGDKKLGFFRADVDYLGLILSDGLRFNEFGDEEIYTISRIATLSRMLDLFFSGYLNKLAEEVSTSYVKSKLDELRKKGKLSPSEKDYKKLLESVLDDKGKLKLGSLIYTVYSGGDDLFVIAPYDLAVEFALRLRDEFRKFTCNNPDFGISGGIFIGRHNTPIHLVAKFAEHLESKAKDARKEKDSVAIFEKVFLWQKDEDGKGISYCFVEHSDKEENSKSKGDEFMILEDIINLAKLFETNIITDKIKRALLYKFLSLYKQYYDSDSGHLNLMIYPKISYYLGRNVKDDNVRKELARALLEGMRGLRKGEGYKPDLIIKNLTVPISLALMKTRKGGE